MIFKPTSIPGVLIIESDGIKDERGAFTRIFCPDEFKDAGIDFHPVQTSIATNKKKHTLRGLHFQLPPREETKLLTVVSGAIFDVAVDMRPDSPTHRKWVGMNLKSGDFSGALIPAGVAHGYITTEPNTAILYQMDSVHRPCFSSGVRWDDPAIGVQWPVAPALISEQDKSWRLLD